jgi:hypothetical protein
MKTFAGILLMSASMLFSAASGAHTASSSFVPRGPEPHASLSDKNHAHRAHGSKRTSKIAGGRTHHSAKH